MPNPQNERSEGEPSFWRLLWRLGRHALHIAFFAFLELFVTKILLWTGKEHELWAHIVQAIAALCFVISFAVLAGAELISDVMDAVDMVRRRIRKR